MTVETLIRTLESVHDKGLLVMAFSPAKEESYAFLEKDAHKAKLERDIQVHHFDGCVYLHID